ncbi:uncharacterized protein EV420DRAFT_1576157 [Desarmillaria tabescens]|uniref:Uncharacterized protein n=1 Tax=Armillaria tabescens TaxID=1929756 RepID=A0AA39MR84_ARMTA|nr:uncharacterized protein EV420DRAFT_1576157 [Desarmillaria tabescens]KAK0443687.1 hypothetical protein EV420DRAFT_1576157 [Desarmillaria tabescens]
MRSPPLSMTICICLSNAQVPIVNLFFYKSNQYRIPWHDATNSGVLDVHTSLIPCLGSHCCPHSLPLLQYRPPK